MRKRIFHPGQDIVTRGKGIHLKNLYPWSSVYPILLCGIILLFYLVPAATADKPVSIGVLLPLSGPEGQPIYDALTLARDQINAGGGIGEHPVQLVLRDTRNGNQTTYARYLANDPDIRVIIGPYTSDDLFQVADMFIQKNKILISPTASSDEIYRAYAGEGSVWRTIANDGDIISVIMQQIRAHGGERVALLTVNSSYGKTFYDWIPYWAIEQGITITGAEEYSTSEDISGAISRLSEGNPDYLVFVHSGNGTEIRGAIDALEDLRTPPLLSLVYPDIDSEGRILERADPETLQFLLASGLWKIDTVSTVSTRIPDGTLMVMTKPFEDGFSAEYRKIAKGNSTTFVPEVYDALLVGAEVMAQFTANPDKSPKSAAMAILTNGTGDPLPRTPEGIQEALNRILQGKLPILTGATGPLSFKPDGCDRLIPWYETYRMERGTVTPDPVIYRKMDKSLIESIKSNVTGTSSKNTENCSVGDFWAVIGALSHDWPNYRHQADALTMYRFLREQGVPDDHIILLIFDDIPHDKRNRKPGEVYHTPAGEEVRKGALPDFTGDQVNKERLIDILSGTGILSDGPALRSGKNSTVLLYLSSHGIENGSLVMGKDDDEILSPNEIASLFDDMKKNKRFGRMLVILESCSSGAIASQVTTDDVTIMTASAPNETSKAAVYDSGLSSWLTDEFTNQLISHLKSSEPSDTLRHLYHDLYYSVRSSHPGVSFGSSSIDTLSQDFFGGKP